jgi:GDPmannose 4,6-dehydratase
MQDCLYLGNLDAKRDWGHAQDYVEMQWLMLQQDEPDDYVIATGQQHSVREFVELAAKYIGINVDWHGQGIDEKGFMDGRCIVAVDPRYFRPTEVETLLGDASKARQKLNWIPKISFETLVQEMAEEDLDLAQRDNHCEQHGFKTFKYYE